MIDSAGPTGGRRRGLVAETFRSLGTYNYRLWAAGALVSNIGTWMQRTAQAWLVLAELTNKDASAVGLVMALQYAPLLLLLPVTGLAADHLDRRKLLIVTQTAMGGLALGLGILTVTGLVRLWHVDLFALLLGCVTAFDSPARQSFVSELVGEAQLPNAVALNSTSFNAARMIGPAVAGVLIAVAGTGWVFVINGASFGAVVAALAIIRRRELNAVQKPARARGAVSEGFSYVWDHPDLRVILAMLFLIGTFGLNFPIFISTMSVTVFRLDAGRYGILSSVMAIGTIAGALLAARRGRTDIPLLIAAGGIFGLGCMFAAIAPRYELFGLALVVIGVAAQTFTTSTNSVIQLSTEKGIRGRVMAIYVAIAMGTTPIGAPIVGWIADRFGPRWALGVGAASGAAAALLGLAYLGSRRARSDA